MSTYGGSSSSVHQSLPPKPPASASLPSKPIPTGPRAQVRQHAYTEPEAEVGMDGEEEEGEGDGDGEMSRMLTHEEVWDDSALIDAWESATAEYEVRFNSSYRWRRYGLETDMCV